jgi:hypothetical protein
LHLATKPKWRRSFDSILYDGWRGINYGAILVQVKNCVPASDTKDLGRKLFASFVLKQWTEEERNMLFFRVVLELGLTRANKKPSNIPVLGRVDLITVSVEEAEKTPNEAAFINKIF